MTAPLTTRFALYLLEENISYWTQALEYGRQFYFEEAALDVYFTEKYKWGGRKSKHVDREFIEAILRKAIKDSRKAH